MGMLTQTELAENQRTIDALKPKLIGRAQAVLHGKSIPQNRQFVSLVEEGVQAACVEELTLFIQYKNAKEGSRSSWSQLADPLVKEILELRESASKLSGEEGENYLQLVKLFLGYLMWEANVQNDLRRKERR